MDNNEIRELKDRIEKLEYEVRTLQSFINNIAVKMEELYAHK